MPINITEEDVLELLKDIADYKPKRKRVVAHGEVGINIQRRRGRVPRNKENDFVITCYTRDRDNNEVVAERQVSTTDDNGNIIHSTKEMIYSAPTIQAAEALAIRKVYDHPYVHRAVYHAPRLKKKDGTIMEFVMDRNTAVAHFLKRDKYRHRKIKRRK